MVCHVEMDTVDLSPVTSVSLNKNALQVRDSVFCDSHCEQFSAQDVLLRFANDRGEGAVEFIEFCPEFNVILSKCFWKDNGYLRYQGEGWVRFNFSLASDATFVFDDAGAFDLKGSELRVFHQPEGVACEHFIHGNASSECVTLSVHESYLRQRLQDMPELSGSCLGQLSFGDNPFFFERFWQTPQTLRIVRELLHVPYQGALRYNYARAKCEELLIAAFHTMILTDRTPMPLRMRDGDWDRIDQARKHIEDDLVQVPAVPELARLVGLNRNKLSYGFKHKFNMSIGQYIVTKRMELAWYMLERDRCSVSEVAALVGYEHVASFSAAFKAHFGLSPKLVTQSR